MEYVKGRHISDPCTLSTLDPLCSPYASSSILNKLRYPADRYVVKVAWLHPMMIQVPES